MLSRPSAQVGCCNPFQIGGLTDADVGQISDKIPNLESHNRVLNVARKTRSKEAAVNNADRRSKLLNDNWNKE